MWGVGKLFVIFHYLGRNVSSITPSPKENLMLTQLNGFQNAGNGTWLFSLAFSGKEIKTFLYSNQRKGNNAPTTSTENRCCFDSWNLFRMMFYKQDRVIFSLGQILVKKAAIALPPQLSNPWWMQNSDSKGFSSAMIMESSMWLLKKPQPLCEFTKGRNGTSQVGSNDCKGYKTPDVRESISA